MCLVTVKKDRDAHDRRVGHGEGNRDVTPEGELDKTVVRHQFVEQDLCQGTASLAL